MPTAQVDQSAAEPHTVATVASEARVSFRQPVASTGSVDAAWWPRSHDLAAELPALLDVLWTAARDITRVTYDLGTWEPTPRRLVIAGRDVRTGGFATGDPLLVELSDAWRRERIDVLVIPPETDPDMAKRALDLAGVAGSDYTTEEIMTHAAEPVPA